MNDVGRLAKLVEVALDQVDSPGCEALADHLVAAGVRAPGQPLARVTIPGRAAGKKTSGSIIYPALMKLKIRKTPNRLARERAGGRKASSIIMSPQDIVNHTLDLIDARQPGAVAAFQLEITGNLRAIIVPPKSHADWLKMALPCLLAVRPRPIVPDDHDVAVETVVYMGPGQRGDLVNFEQATWDALEAAGVIRNDDRVNGHAASRRDWTEPQDPRVELAIYDLGPRVVYEVPKVRVRGLAAHKAAAGPLRFTIEAGEKSVPGCSMPHGTGRRTLVMRAEKLWRQHHREGLPEDAVIRCGGDG